MHRRVRRRAEHRHRAARDRQPGVPRTTRVRRRRAGRPGHQRRRRRARCRTSPSTRATPATRRPTSPTRPSTASSPPAPTSFIGAASSGVSFTFIDKLVENCKIHFSPANTSPDFTTYADDDLYFRTAPSDVLQGRVLADLMIEDGVTNATFIALQDPYGEGLLEYSSEPFEEQGGEIVDSFTYDPQRRQLRRRGRARSSSGNPDALVLIGFEESAQILTTLFESGFTADQKNIYLVDGNVGNALGEQLPAGSLVGVKGTLPAGRAHRGLPGPPARGRSGARSTSATARRPTTRSSSWRSRPRSPAPTTRRRSPPHINGVTRDGDEVHDLRGVQGASSRPATTSTTTALPAR